MSHDIGGGKRGGGDHVDVASVLDARVTPKAIAWEVKTPTAVAHSQTVSAALRKLQVS